MSIEADFLSAFAQSLSALSLYPAGHVSRERALDSTFGKLSDLLSEDSNPFFSFLENEVVYRNTPLREMRNWEWSDRFAAIGMQRLEFDQTVTREELERVAALLSEQATAITAIAEVPDIDRALSNAATLDEFCVDVDVIVGLSVIARAGQVLHGTQLRALAESNGLELDSNGVSVLYDANGEALFTMDNQESKPFRAEQLKELVTQGVTFLLDVPRTGDGLKVFNKMVTTCRQFAESLDGTLCDDNRVMLNDTGLEKIRNKLRSIYETMEQRGIPAGSESARNLFS